MNDVKDRQLSITIFTGIFALITIALIVLAAFIFPKQPVYFLSDQHICYIKEFLLILGIIILGIIEISRRTANRLLQQKMTVFLAMVTFCGALAHINFFQFHFNSAIHRSDIFHYFLGAKYFQELQHDGLYECTLIADLEDQYKYSSEKSLKIFNVRNGHMMTRGSMPLQGVRCRSAFSSIRWLEFKTDVAAFRENTRPRTYTRFFSDRGYNNSPLWTALYSPILQYIKASSLSLMILSFYDYLLLIILFYILYKSFGSIPTYIAALFYFCNAFTTFRWVGGSFARFDWFVLLGLGFAALRSEKGFLAGLLHAIASILRIFPLLPIALSLTSAFLNKNSNKKQIKHYLFGFITGAILSVCLPILYLGYDISWPLFFHNLSRHVNYPGTNRMSLSAVFIYIFETHPSSSLTVMLQVAFILIIIALYRNFSLLHLSITNLCALFLLPLSNYYLIYLSFIGLLWRRFWAPSFLLLILGVCSWHVSSVKGDITSTRFWSMISFFFSLSVYIAILLQEHLNKRKSL